MFSLKTLFSSAETRRDSTPDSPHARSFRRASGRLGGILVAACLIEFLFWLLRVYAPGGDFLPENFPRQPLAALAGFLLIGLGALSVRRMPLRTRLLQAGFGAAVALIGLASINIGRIEFWWMDTLTSWIVLLLGLVLMTGGSRVPVVGYVRQLLTFSVFFLCGLVLVSYVYEVSDLEQGLVSFLRIPWTSSLCGILAGHALLFQHPNFGVMRIASGRGFGSAVVRRLLPTSILLLLGLGWLLAFGENYDFYPESFGESLYAVLAITGFSGLLLVTANYLNRLDRERGFQERELRRSQRQLQSILDNTTSIICMKDLDGNYLIVNRSFCRAAARSSEECLRMNVRDLFDPAQAANILAHDRRALESREAHEYIETMVCADGPRVHLCASFPVLDWEGNPYAVCGVYTDITAIKQQEEEIKHLNQSLREKTRRQEAANDELEAFSYSVSHDLRAPLRHISGFGQLLSQRNRDVLDEKSRHYLDVILTSVDRMGALIDDLLAFSRASKIDLSWKRIPTEELVREVRAELETHRTGPEVTWEVGHLPDAEGDPAMLRLVWVNLLSNAMKYSGKNPAPRISVHCVPNGAGEEVFSVRDNGAGFDMRYADKLFGVFQRLHSNQEYEGTGIGLAMIRRILERHGGRIWAEASPGQGACFYFVLPTTKSTADKVLAEGA